MKRNGNCLMIKKAEQEEYIKKFRQIMEVDKAYYDPEISLNSVAKSLNLQPKQLSILINTRLHHTFRESILNYRLKECMLLLENCPEKTIQEIMFETGFNSKSSFYTFFKKHTGLTPSEYRDKQ
jgi:AraC-like DNA-binding protein